MTMMISKWGNSLGLRIPQAVVKEAGFGLGTSVRVTAQKGRIILEPAPYDIKHLIKGISAQNRHAAVTTGTPAGQEIW